jgi:hypothetical protein
LVALLRLIFVVPFAYVVAMAAAGLTVTYGIAILTTGAPPTAGFFATAFIANTILVSAVTFIFASLAIIIAEAAAIRSLYHYLATGVALGLAANLILFMVALNPMLGMGMLLYPAGGLVGAVTYWLIAGRTAGAGTAIAETER